MTDHTNPVAIEIARLLAHGEGEDEVILTLATKFPDVSFAEFDETLRDVIALQRLVAAELAESEWELTQLKAELPKHQLSARQSTPPKWACGNPTFH